MKVARLKVLFDRLHQLAEIISGSMFAGIFVVFLLGIFMRYVLGRPLVWGDELAILLLLWCTLFTDAFVVRSSDHIAFDVVWEIASPRARRIMGITGSLVFALIYLAALPIIADYVLFLWREKTDVLEWRLDLVFFCFVIYMGMMVVRLVMRLLSFCGPGWRDHVADPDTGNAANIIG
jgi:TRAP-type C4-dicarboxylate transport system permease small subunit